jgi:hypothetical protein
MANPKLLALVTALMLVVGTPVAFGAVSQDQLQQLETLIVSQQWADLNAYLLEHPELVSGNDVLADELKVFLASYSQGVLSPSFTPPSVAIVEQLLGTY